MIVPAGLPCWIRSSDHTVYGGDLNKVNWHTQGNINSRTDVAAEAFCRLAEDISACARTAPFCIITVQCNDASPGPPTILFTNQMTGVRITAYTGNAAPAGFPSGARNGTGDVTLTWSPAYTDDYGVSGNVHIVHASVSVISSVPLFGNPQMLDPNADGLNEAVRVRIFDTGPLPQADAKFCLWVCTGTA